jgi:hypothetical protein
MDDLDEPLDASGRADILQKMRTILHSIDRHKFQMALAGLYGDNGT